MSLQAATGMDILRRAYQRPEVQNAQQRLDVSKERLDRYERSQTADRNTLFTLEPQLYESTWKMQAHTAATFVAPLFLAGMAGCAIGASMAAAAVPALAPFRGLLMIGSLIAGWKLVPRAIGWGVRKFILPPMVARSMRRELAWKAGETREEVERAQRRLDAVVQQATEQLYKEAAEKAAAQPDGPPPEVTVDETTVTVGKIKLQKNPSSAPHA